MHILSSQRLALFFTLLALSGCLAPELAPPQSTTIARIVTGDSDTCAISNKGAVVCWGAGDASKLLTRIKQNHFGLVKDISIQRAACAVVELNGISRVLCEGNNTDGLAQPQNNLVQATRVFVGSQHSCAETQLGLQCWGNKAEIDSTPFTQGKKIGSVSLGFDHTCAIIDGRASCWGDNTSGWGSLYRSVPADMTNAQDISAGMDHNCAIVSGGVKCWGYNDSGQLNVPAMGETIKVDSGIKFSCALSKSGVFCWGEGEHGQTNVPSLTSPTDIAVGADHACAIDTHGVKCWGYNARGSTDVPADLLAQLEAATPDPADGTSPQTPLKFSDVITRYGDPLTLNYLEARDYCVALGGRLPTAREYAVFAGQYGFEISDTPRADFLKASTTNEYGQLDEFYFSWQNYKAGPLGHNLLWTLSRAPTKDYDFLIPYTFDPDQFAKFIDRPYTEANQFRCLLP